MDVKAVAEILKCQIGEPHTCSARAQGFLKGLRAPEAEGYVVPVKEVVIWVEKCVFTRCPHPRGWDKGVIVGYDSVGPRGATCEYNNSVN